MSVPPGRALLVASALIGGAALCANDYAVPGVFFIGFGTALLAAWVTGV